MQFISILAVMAALKATAALPLVSGNDHTHIPGAGKISNGIDEVTGKEPNGTVAQYGTFLCDGPYFSGTCIHMASAENQCSKSTNIVHPEFERQQSNLGYRVSLTTCTFSLCPVQLGQGVSSVGPDKGVHCRYF